MDEALKKPTKRRPRKADGIDLEQMADAEIEDMRRRMTSAAQMDAVNRREGKPAMYKLKMLPEVVSLLNRNQYVNSLVDPEINLLEAVKFFLEPLDDGSLPAYNIQRDLMTSLGKLPINKETLVASGIGKVIVFYTKSKRPEAGIKRMAERLLAEWTRPILQRSDDYSKRVYQEVAFDPRYAQSLFAFYVYIVLLINANVMQQTPNARPAGIRRSNSGRGSSKGTPPASLGQPRSRRYILHQLHGRTAADNGPGKQVRTPSWIQRRGSVSENAGKADCCVEGWTEVISLAVVFV